MKRFHAPIRLLPIAGVALLLALASCRSPVQGRAEGSLSLSLSIPADLSSDVPEPIRRAIGEAELADSRPRFIHPDGKIVKASVTKTDGSKAGSATVSLEAGATNATLSITDLPLNEPLTLTVTVCDDSDTKLGERVVELGALSEAKTTVSQSVNVLPVESTSVELGIYEGSGYGSPSLTLSNIEDKVYIYSVELPSYGLYIAQLLPDGSKNDYSETLRVYDYNGVVVSDYVNDNFERSGFGLFTSDTVGSSPYYFVFRGDTKLDLSELMLMVCRVSASPLVILGKKPFDPDGNALIDVTSTFPVGGPLEEYKEALSKLEPRNIFDENGGQIL